ncbi:hypothetical protein GRI40_08285 [Altererythrobacter aerius]|uniref:OmpR/PhoB-type domain-containing protein n=1 Tax=Tsuneonella aeria TaxID=1837929 RepID=A0A6I4TD99_9SPHN|nr:winged helix-turn-helix domain-containing protein [Tsuneonella aeria]MXO75212.1 hypothetical protein [Tsuneonella aeria]
MDVQRTEFDYVSPRDLSRVPAFAIGPLHVDPPTRTIFLAERKAVLEPRVMQVLVALGLEPGQVLSRDDLIALCWNGVIVGDNAINRVISLIRQALAAVAGDAVHLETITKVGFRLVVAHPEGADNSPDTPDIAKTSRRGMMAYAGLAAIAAAGGAALIGRKTLFGDRADPDSVELVERARLLQLTGEPGTSEQAISFLKQAVTIDPRHADAWGALSLAYLLALAGFTGRDTATMAELMTNAAQRGLELEPDQRDAAAVLAFSRPAFGNYARFDRATERIVRRYPDYWYAYARRAMFLRDVGRVNESLPFADRSIELDPMLPIGWGNVALGHFLAGDVRESDARFEQAGARWPAHGYLWNTRFQLLLESRRYDAAASLALDPQARPDYVPREAGEWNARLAWALRDGDRQALAGQRSMLVEQAAQAPQAAQYNAPLLVMMGFAEDALDSLTRLYAIAGTAPGVAHQTATVVLFRPSMTALQSDERYRALLEVSGLEAYWQQSGSQPDFRRN